MDQRTIDLSVVIPTYNRCERLARVLDALAEQRTRTDAGRAFAFDVIVVSDGSTDGTNAMVRDFAASFPLRLIEQDNAGPGAARNAGIDASEAEIVVFIDDDVIPEPGLLAAHAAMHGDASPRVVVGPMLTPSDGELSPWVAWEQHQLEKQYRSLAATGVMHHRQFYTGNASVPASALREVGGFDTSFRRAEDVELAHRLHLLGLDFVFEPRAEGYHYAERSLDSWCQVASDYGANDVIFSETQPEVRKQLRGFFFERHRMIRWTIALLVRWRGLSAAVRRALRSVIVWMPRIGLAGRERPLLSVLYALTYYGGVIDQLGSPSELRAVLRGERTADRFVAWFALEQTLGHITHGKNLSALVPEDDSVEAVFLPIDDALDGVWRHVPGWSNWTVRSGVRARRMLRTLFRDPWMHRPDALFVHSQVPAVLLGRWMTRIPTVVSLDATPLQYDALGEFYRHDVGSGPTERLKKWANERCFRRAAHIVTWSEWAKRGLVADYRVEAARITVIAPGVDVGRWAAPGRDEGVSGPIRVLFVGGDLERKGGRLLLEAARRLRAEQAERGDIPAFEICLVTPTPVDEEEGLVVHAGLTANSPELIEQYHLADIFCLPTQGDCLPMVLAEAGAAGLPLISTDVGAISEIVRDGETGCLIPPDDLDALVGALRKLLVDAAFRRSCGTEARRLVEQSHDAQVNAGAILGVMRAAVG